MSTTSALAVKFYSRPYEMEFESQVQGRPIVQMRDYVRIETPGNQLNVVDTFVRDDHKHQFPLEWARYLNEKNTDGEHKYTGTALTDWSLLNPAQAMELKHYKFYTVEQIAEASDMNIGQIGMLAGMNPLALRDKAKAFLANAKQSAAAMHRVDELAEQKQKNADLEAQLTRQGEMLQKLMDAQMAQENAEPVKNKGGRPKKVTEDVETS